MPATKTYMPPAPSIPHPSEFRWNQAGYADRIEDYCRAVTAADTIQPESFAARVVVCTRDTGGKTPTTSGFYVVLDNERQARSIASVMLAELPAGLRLTVETYPVLGADACRVVVSE